MADSYLVVLLEVNGRSASSIPELNGVANLERLDGLVNVLNKLDNGLVKGRVTHYLMDDTGTKPTGTIVCDQTYTDGNYVTFDLAGQTWTLTEGTDFIDGASDTTCALALSNAINETTGLKDLVTAAAVTTTVTLTYHFPSQVGQDLEMSTDDAPDVICTVPVVPDALVFTSADQLCAVSVPSAAHISLPCRAHTPTSV